MKKSDKEFKEIIESSYNLAEVTKKLGFKWRNCGENSRRKIRERMEKLNVKFKDLIDYIPKKINVNTQGRLGLTKVKGDISECAISLEFLKLGIPVLKPIGDNCPYDLAIDYKDKIYKVQVKTARITNMGTSIICKLMTSTIGIDKKRIHRKYLPNEVDIFALYCIETNESCFIHFNETIDMTCIQFSRERKKFGHIKRDISNYSIKDILKKLDELK